MELAVLRFYVQHEWALFANSWGVDYYYCSVNNFLLVFLNKVKDLWFLFLPWNNVLESWYQEAWIEIVQFHSKGAACFQAWTPYNGNCSLLLIAYFLVLIKVCCKMYIYKLSKMIFSWMFWIKFCLKDSTLWITLPGSMLARLNPRAFVE